MAALAAVATACLPIPPPPAAPPPGPPPTIAVYGDSVALTLGWDAPAGVLNRAEFVGGVTWPGCGAGRGGYRWHLDKVATLPSCDRQYEEWAKATATTHPDIAVIVEGPWDQLLRLTPGDSQWRALGDPMYDSWLLREMLLATDTLLDNGAGKVVWVVAPPMEIPENDPTEQDRRAAAMRDLIDWVGALRPGRTQIVDMWARFDSATDDLIRPDGVHLSSDGAVYVWRTWLADAIGI